FSESEEAYFARSSVKSINANGFKHVFPDGFIGGLGAGYNLQRCNIVYGLEVDFDSFSTHAQNTTTVVYPDFAPTSYTIHQSIGTDWLLTVRPRLGYSFGNVLVYGTGGVSLTDLRYREQFTDTFAAALETGSRSATRFGWNVGAGVEYALTCQWSLKAEYIFT